MAGAALSLSLNNLASLFSRKAEDLAKLSFQKPLREVRTALIVDTLQNFHEGHSPDGTAWLPLKNPSAKRGGASAKPLRDTSILMGSVIGHGAGNIDVLTGNSLTWGTNVAYAAVHQFGHTFQRPARSRQKPWVFVTDTGKKVFTRKLNAYSQTIPARPFLGINDRLESKIIQLLGAHVCAAVAL